MVVRKTTFDYKSVSLIEGYVEPQKQAAKRHYGSHQFFTKRAWNVVQAYIQHFTQPGDTVLDPYGGSGVTAIESLVLNRKAINVDISPLAIFLADVVAMAPVDIIALTAAYQAVREDCQPQLEAWTKMSNAKLEKEPLKWWYPKDYKLPQNADKEFVHELFTRRQLLSLSCLLARINRIEDGQIRDLLRYNFAATMYKCNLTFLSAANRIASRGGSSIFSIYRYKVAKKPVALDVWEQFELRFRKLLACKEETNREIGDNYSKRGHFRNIRGSATRLSKLIRPNSVDYIFTDPPYGAHIAYLDLSAMWNAWLGFEITAADFRDEVIEGGDRKKTSHDYFSLLDKSFEEMFKVLKYDRWLSVVFAHKDPAYWDAVVKAAVRHGFQYIGTKPQPLNVVWSMHKKKNYLTVMSGELILNFLKVKNPVTIAITNIGSDAIDIIRNVAELVIVRNDGATTDEIYHELIPKLLENGLLSEVKSKVSDITPILAEKFDYDKNDQQWEIRPNTKLGSSIPLESRVRFYILDYLRRCERQNQRVTFDDIVHNVLPNLINGEQPTKKTILEELRRVAAPADDRHWGLASTTQPQIGLDFDYPKDQVLPSLVQAEKDLSHNEIIVLLARMARHCRFGPVIGKKERTADAYGLSLASLSDDLSMGDIDDYHRKKIEQIDCVWSVKGIPKVAFEVETSTSITTGIERFASLLEFYSRTAGYLVLVVPGSRRRKLNDVLFNSSYVGHPMYMENKVRYLYISDLISLYKAFAKRTYMDNDTGLDLLRTHVKTPDSLKR